LKVESCKLQVDREVGGYRVILDYPAVLQCYNYIMSIMIFTIYTRRDILIEGINNYLMVYYWIDCSDIHRW